jgi:hypothetical protein
MPQNVVSDAVSALRTLRSLRFKAFEDYSPRRTRGEKQKIPVSCGSISPATAASHFGCQGNARRLPLTAVFYDRFIDQQNGDVVPHGIDAVTLAALQALTRFLLHKRLLAHWTYQNVEQFLRNHSGILPPNGGRRIKLLVPSSSSQFQFAGLGKLETGNWKLETGSRNSKLIPRSHDQLHSTQCPSPTNSALPSNLRSAAYGSCATW